MINNEIKIEKYYSLRPTEYPIIEQLHIDQELSREAEHHQQTLTLTLRSRDDLDTSRLVLSFSKVRQFHLSQGISILELSTLSIRPVDSQWEDIRFKVSESEQGVEFSFFCYDFTATLIERCDD